MHSLGRLARSALASAATAIVFVAFCVQAGVPMRVVLRVFLPRGEA